MIKQDRDFFNLQVKLPRTDLQKNSVPPWSEAWTASRVRYTTVSLETRNPWYGLLTHAFTVPLPEQTTQIQSENSLDCWKSQRLHNMLDCAMAMVTTERHGPSWNGNSASWERQFPVIAQTFKDHFGWERNAEEMRLFLSTSVLNRMRKISSDLNISKQVSSSHSHLLWRGEEMSVLGWLHG